MPIHPKQSHPFVLSRFSVRHLSSLPTLAIQRLLGFAAGALVGVFFPIFLYEFFGLSIQLVLLWYALLFVARLPFFVIAAKIFSKTGLIKSMFIGILGAIIFYVTGYFLDVTGGESHPYVLLAIAIVGLTILAGFYWAPFHVDFAKFSSKGKRGRQVAIFYDVQRLVGIAAPALGGFLIATYSYSVIFIYAALIKVLSLFPLAFLPQTSVQYEFGYFESFKKMFQKPFRWMTFSMIALGAESVVAAVIWPVFLFVILDGNYLDVGLITAAIVIISLGLQFMIGSQVDKGKGKKILRWGSGIYALGWISKSLVESVVGIFAASTFHSFGSIMMRTPLDAMMYEQAADSGHYIDEYTVLRETALTIGRLGMMILLIGVTTWFSIPAAFIFAGFISLGVNLLVRFHAQQ